MFNKRLLVKFSESENTFSGIELKALKPHCGLTVGFTCVCCFTTVLF